MGWWLNCEPLKCLKTPCPSLHTRQTQVNAFMEELVVNSIWFYRALQIRESSNSSWIHLTEECTTLLPKHFCRIHVTGFSKRGCAGEAIIWKGKVHDCSVEKFWPPQFFGPETLLLRIMYLPEISNVIFRL